MSTASRSHTREMALAALLAALLAASAWVTVPTPWDVPFTRQVLVVVLIGLLLRPGWAIAAVIAYVLAGVAGLPVFSGMKAGVSVLVGPTGGYIFGFVLGAGLASVVARSLGFPGRRPWADAVASATAIAMIYVLGWLQLATVMDLGLGEAAALGVLPYIAPDAVKAALAVSLAATLRVTLPGLSSDLAEVLE